MTVPKWVSTTLSFVLIGLILVTHAPPKIAPVAASNTNVVAPTPTSQMTITSHPSFTHPLIIGAINMDVAFAKTPAEQEQGLSDTAPLWPGQGMLFIFSQENQTGFWMKDMNYPLDIIWIGIDKKVADISPNLDPSTYPKIFSPSKPIEYVLEVPAGFAKQNNISIGTQLSF